MMSWQPLTNKLLWLCLLWLVACRPDSGDDLLQVVRVGDGDTLTVLSTENKQMRVRLHGIDAPERGQPYGKVATKRLRELSQGGVRVVEQSKDKYGRIVADVYNSKGEWLNLKLVEEGLAWHYARYSNDHHLANAERTARARGLGLWEQAKPQPPWVYRKQKR
jgi:endonuclease YncB( thermonuclease family)